MVEVELTIRQAPSSQFNPTSSHTLRAFIAPDGSRCYQLDGKNKTAMQCREFLSAYSLYLDQPSAVIRQATVTQLADTNSEDAIGAVLANASGLAK